MGLDAHVRASRTATCKRQKMSRKNRRRQCRANNTSRDDPNPEQQETSDSASTLECLWRPVDQFHQFANGGPHGPGEAQADQDSYHRGQGVTEKSQL